MNVQSYLLSPTGTRWLLGRWAMLAITMGSVAACGGGEGDDVVASPTVTAPVTAPLEVAAPLALLGELVAPTDPSSTTAEAQAELTAWMPPNNPEAVPAEFPPELLPPA